MGTGREGDGVRLKRSLNSYQPIKIYEEFLDSDPGI